MLTFRHYWVKLLPRARKEAAGWFETWQAWVALGGALTFVLAIYLASAGDWSHRVWALIGALITPVNATIAIAAGVIVALLEAGRSLYNEREQSAREVEDERDALKKTNERLELDKRGFQEEAIAAKAKAREAEERLKTLQSMRDDIKKLAEYEIEGEELRNGPDFDGPALDRWKTKVGGYIRQHHPEDYTKFSAPVTGGMTFGHTAPPSPQAVAFDLLKRLRVIIDQLRGLERKAAPGPSQPQNLPPGTVAPGLPTMDK